jgi:hypothetical protein
MAVVVEVEEAQQAVDIFSGLAGGQVAKLRDHGEVFGTGEMGVEIGLLGNITHAALVGDEVVEDRFSGEEDFAEGALDEAGNHLHGG